MMDCRKAGFTLVEVVVTMVVTSLLLIAAMQIQYQATNLSIILKDTTGTVDGLPGAVTQRVVATAPYGCGVSSGLGLPIKVESIVIYKGGSSTHAAYAAY